MVDLSPTRSRTRSAILDAAAEAFRKEGFDRTSMDEIAKRANVARGTVYNNFESKEDVAIGVAERLRVVGYQHLSLMRANGADTLSLFESFFSAAGRSIAENREAFFYATVAAARGVGRTPTRPGTTQLFTELVVQGQQEGVFRQDLSAPVIARLLSALLTQSALQGPDASFGEIENWPMILLRTAFEGVLNSEWTTP